MTDKHVTTPEDDHVTHEEGRLSLLRERRHFNVMWIIVVLLCGVMAWIGFGNQGDLASQNSKISSQNRKISSQARHISRQNEVIASQNKRITAQNSHIAAQDVKIQKFERSICRVQQRGLPAGHHLANFVGDLSMYLTDLLDEATPAQKSAVPMPQLDLLESLASEGKKYQQIESKQPQTQKC